MLQRGGVIGPSEMLIYAEGHDISRPTTLLRWKTMVETLTHGLSVYRKKQSTARNFKLSWPQRPIRWQ